MPQVAVLGLAILLDFAIGDPRWFPHPVRFIGFVIKKLERPLRKLFPPFIGGILLVIIVVGGTYAGSFYLVKFLSTLSYFGYAVMVLLLSTTIAIRGLIGEVANIIRLVRLGSVERARVELRSLVGRDTKNLDEGGILRAVVESLAENTSDGIIAPMFYFVIGGLPLAMAYKAVNTLDSMVGYRNERYMLFGRASARLDDLANLIPARLTGFFISIAAFIMGLEGKRAFRTMLRDGRKHPSPNSGVPMAAMAGALDVTLGGPAFYGGKFFEKEFIGRGKEKVSIELARTALRLGFLSSVIGAIFLGALLGVKTW